ncbi:MAG: hypothetical protein ABIJ57_01290 [Pseudomonadota bacterium]
MKLSAEHRVELMSGDETVTFILRQPTNKELNDFLAERYEVGRRGKMKDHSLQARIELFDLLLIAVENLEGTDGKPITGPDRKDEIPPNWKGAVIFKEFEDIEINEKN